MENFHTWDEWKSAMMTLPEDVFFDLLRSVFGHIKTPFNKQNLLADLAAFLSRDDIRRNIAAYLDEADARVIAAVALLRNPTAAELEQFFAGEEPEIAALLPNLEERFILYRYREGNLFRLALNPVLEPVLAAAAGNRPVIFPSLPPEEGAAGGEGGPEAPGPGARTTEPRTTGPQTTGPRITGTVPPDDRLFAALISFVLDEGSLFRPEGRRGEYRLRRKVLDRGQRIFPGADPELMIRSLLCLGLCRAGALPSAGAAAEGRERGREGEDEAGGADAEPGGGSEGEPLRPEDRALGAFRDLEPRHRQIYWAAGLYLGAELSPGVLPAPPLIRGRLRGLAQLIDRFLGVLNPARVYPPRTLRRLLLFLEREGGGPAVLSGPGASGPGAAELSPGEALCGALAGAGLLIGGPRGYRLAGSPRPGGPAAGPRPGQGPAPAERDAPVLAMDTPFSCLVYPGIGFADALTLALFTAARETGPVFRFEITRESCLRGFERGLGAAEMEELLTRLSGTPPASSLVWTLKDWEKRSAEVSLFEGAVLVLSPERRYLAETGALGALIRRELAPGLYLLDSADRAAEALRKAGVDMFTRGTGRAGQGAPGLPGKTGAPSPFAGGIHSPFPALGKRRPGYHEAGTSAMIDGPDGTGGAADPAPGGTETGGAAEALKARFRGSLAGRSLSAPARAELAARIERRQVLTEAQLDPASVRGEKLEARGLDYVGKAAIAKQALVSRSLVEVLWSGGGGERRMVGVPLALEKSGGESMLVIGDVPPAAGAARGQGDTFRIPLGKISLLRRIKKSIFEDGFPKA
jgi:hypothetical protein